MSLGAQALGWNVAAGVDLNGHALKSFERNFPNARAITASVRSTKALNECCRVFSAAPGPKIVVSGPPCQGFSAAGPRNPTDPRNQILIAVARAIIYLNPDFALVENVSMLLSPKNSRRLKLFDQTLQAGGYHVVRMVLDASEFGVPQRRKRTLIFITREAFAKEKIERSLENLRQTPKTVRETLSDLPHPRIRPKRKSKTGGPSDTVKNHVAMRHSSEVKRKIAKIPPGTGPLSYRRLDPDKIANTLISGHRAPPAHYSQARSITTREAARLQGFPDAFEILGSFGNQMEQVTNAVPPPLASAALIALIESTAMGK